MHRLHVADGRDPKLAAALMRGGVLHLIRQSTQSQVERNLMSREDQLGQVIQLAPYGITANSPENQYRLLDARAETATRLVRRNGQIKHRATFESMLHLLETGLYTVLLISVVSRLARNALDTGRLLDVLRRKRVIVRANGASYDIQDPGQEFVLGMLLGVATLQAEQFRTTAVATRQTSADKGELMHVLPTGLTYASPDSVPFRSALEQAGLGTWLEDLQALGTGFRSSYREGRLYVFPFPDRDVYAATSIAIQRLEKRRSTARVARDIRAGIPGWPAEHIGEIPVIRESVWQPGIVVSWCPVASVQLRQWLSSEALFGIYAHRSDADAVMRTAQQVPDTGLAANGTVWRPNQFKGSAPLEDWSLVQPLLKRPERRDRVSHCERARRSYVVARNHVLPELRCGEMVDEVRCGRPVTPIYDPDGAYHYANLQCNHGDVSVQRISPSIEPVVLHAMLSALSPEAIDGLFSALRVATGGAADKQSRLTREYAQLTRSIEQGLAAAKLAAEGAPAVARRLIAAVEKDQDELKEATRGGEAWGAGARTCAGHGPR